MDIERIKTLASAWFLPAAAAAAAVAAAASAVHVLNCGQGPRPGPAAVRSGPAAVDRALIPGGTFLMGSAEGEGQAEERPRHAVTLSAYYMDRREVSVGQYRAFAESSGRAVPRQGPWSTDSHPVVNVDWYDAEAYCAWAGGRLPTEAEWERAARGGTAADFDLEKDRKKLDEYSWDSLNSGDLPRPTGLKAPNAFGLYDMRGNVWEWVRDRMDPDYYRKSPARDPSGPDSGVYRVMRGGSVRYDGSYLRMAYRGSNYPCFRAWDAGFRCAVGAGVAGGPEK